MTGKKKRGVRMKSGKKYSGICGISLFGKIDDSITSEPSLE